MAALEDVFRSGTLEMSEKAWESLSGNPAWSAVTTNRILAVLAVVLLVADLLDLFRLAPQLAYCYDRSRGAESLEHSLGMARSRNTAALFLSLPFCLVADRYHLFLPGLWSVIPPAWSAPATIGALAVFLLLRRFMYLILRPRRLGTEAFDALRHNLYNYLFLLVPVMLLTVAVSKMGMPDSLTRTVLLVETALAWGFALLRSGQILGAHCSGLSTFLYLCGLELLPAAALVTADVLF